MIKLIIFSLSGVLADLQQVQYDTLFDSIAEIVHIPPHEFIDYIQQDGTTTLQKLAILKEKLDLSDLEISLIDDRKQQKILREYYRNLYPNTQQITMLDELNKKYKLAIASNSRKETVLRVLNIQDIVRFFPIITTSSDLIIPKPKPDMFIKIVNATNVAPCETLILESTIAGCQAAKAFGSHLMKINTINDVTLSNIETFIKAIN